MKKFNNIYYVISDNKKDNEFVGFKIIDNKPIVFYPRAYRVNTNDFNLFKRDIIHILKSISLAKQKSKAANSLFTKKTDEYELPIDSMLWLLEDYIKNGYYIEVEKVSKLNENGRINWKKTIQTQQPIISNASFIYKSIIVDKHEARNSLISEIYKYAVLKSHQIIGWIYNYKIEITSTIKYDLDFFISSIKKELQKTFLDIKIERLAHILNVLTGLDSILRNSKNFSYGVNNYDVVFEKMVNELYGNVDNIKEYYPYAEWEIINNPTPQKSSDLRPDTIIKSGENIYIIDSKYYGFGGSKDVKDLPNTSTIQKQITYGEYIEKKLNDENKLVKNAFILPYNKEDNIFELSSDVEYFGRAKSKWRNNDREYDFIQGIFVDITFLIYNWNKKRKAHIQDLTSLIDSNSIDNH